MRCREEASTHSVLQQNNFPAGFLDSFMLTEVIQRTFKVVLGVLF